MHQIMYISTATVQVPEEELIEMLSQFRRNNHRDNITGLLLYSGEHFVQLIEGAKEDLDQLFEKIVKDYHHQNVIKLADGEINCRLFSDWSMGFKAVSEEALSGIKGYVNPANPAFLNTLSGQPEESAVTVLQNFARLNLAEISYQ